MNKIIIIGNLGRDPEMRYSTSGNPMTSFSVAENRRYTVAGEQRESTEWFNCTASGRLADICNQYLSRGQQVYIEGRLSSRQYDRRDGTPGFSLDVVVTEMQMVGRRDDQQSDGGSGYGGEARSRYDRPTGDRYAGSSGGCGGREREQERDSGSYGAPAGRGGGYSPPPSGGDDMDVDDLPF